MCMVCEYMDIGVPIYGSKCVIVLFRTTVSFIMIFPTRMSLYYFSDGYWDCIFVLNIHLSEFCYLWKLALLAHLWFLNQWPQGLCHFLDPLRLFPFTLASIRTCLLWLPYFSKYHSPVLIFLWAMNFLSQLFFDLILYFCCLGFHYLDCGEQKTPDIVRLERGRKFTFSLLKFILFHTPLSKVKTLHGIRHCPWEWLLVKSTLASYSVSVCMRVKLITSWEL